MKIFICDDEKSTCSELEEVITEYASEKNVQIDVMTFLSGDTLTSYLKNWDKPDILFLDIELPGMDGIGVGSFIRESLENEYMFIVYISSKEQYALELFQNRPFDFLVKPLTGKSVFGVLDKILKLMHREEENGGYFEFQDQKTYYRLWYRDILYFRSNNKKVDIVTNSGIKNFYGKLSAIEHQLPASVFLYIHKSFLVNFNHVKEYTYEQVIMLNGDVLSISKGNRAAIRKKILEREKNGISNG